MLMRTSSTPPLVQLTTTRRTSQRLALGFIAAALVIGTLSSCQSETPAEPKKDAAKPAKTDATAAPRRTSAPPAARTQAPRATEQAAATPQATVDPAKATPDDSVTSMARTLSARVVEGFPIPVPAEFNVESPLPLVPVKSKDRTITSLRGTLEAPISQVIEFFEVDLQSRSNNVIKRLDVDGDGGRHSLSAKAGNDTYSVLITGSRETSKWGVLITVIHHEPFDGKSSSSR